MPIPVIAGIGESTLDERQSSAGTPASLSWLKVASMWDRAQRAGIDQTLDFAQRRLEAAFVADPEHEAALMAGAHHLAGVRAGERERLLAEHVLAGGGAGQDLGMVQRVWRREDHRLEIRVAERLVQARRQREAVLRGERRGRPGIDVDRAHHPQLLRALQTPDDGPAPPAKPHHGGADHRGRSSNESRKSIRA
jgi:hypothetical protein